MSKVSGKSNESGGRSRVFRWFLAALIVVTVVWLGYLLAGRILPRIALGQMSELTNTKISVGSLDFDFDGSVHIEALEVAPHKKGVYDATILKAKKVYARFSTGSLLLLRPRLKEIHVQDFVLDVRYDLDTGWWNVSALKIKLPAGGIGEMPVVLLDGGEIRYNKVSGGESEVAALVPIDAKFGPDDDAQSGCAFEVTTAEMMGRYGKNRLQGKWQPGMVTVTGGVSTADMPALERAWDIHVLALELLYNEQKDYSLKLRARDVLGTPSRSPDKFLLGDFASAGKSNPITALQKFFERFRPSGRIDFELDASGNLDRLLAGEFRGKVLCRDVTLWDRDFPYKMEHLRGQVSFSDKDAIFNGLSAEHADVRLAINGVSRNAGSMWQYEAQIASDNMLLDNDLYEALRQEQQQFWSVFSPEGLAAIDFSVRQQSQTDIEKTLTVELLDVAAVCEYFPYPLKNVKGDLAFDVNDVTFSNLVSQFDGRKVTMDGKISSYSNERPMYEISIDVEDVPLDSTLAAALPDKQRILYNQCHPSGFGRGHIRVYTPEESAEPVTFVAALSFRDGSLQPELLPQAITGISAEAVFTPDMVQVDRLDGQYDEGGLTVSGRIWPGETQEQLKYDMLVSGERAKLADSLYAMVPEDLMEIISQLQPVGRINYVADVNRAGEDDADYEIVVDCLGGSINFRQLPYPLKDITGRLMIDKDSITLENVTAVPGDAVLVKADSSAVRVNGRATLDGSSFGGGVFDISAEDIFFEERLGLNLPKAVRPFYERLLPSGRFDLDFKDMKIRVGQDGERYVDFVGWVNLENCLFKMSGARTKMDALLTTAGSYKGGYGFLKCRAELLADTMQIQGQVLEDLRAEIVYDENLRQWCTRDLVADCYGGRLAGKFELKQPVDGPLQYTLQAGFDSVDLKEFLAEMQLESGEEENHTTGKMNGSLNITARLGDSSSRIGSCKLTISNMQAGKVPLLAKLLSVLRLREPTEFAFDSMFIDSYIKRDSLLVRRLDLSGPGLAFYGGGWVDLPSKNLDLILIARGKRLATADPSVLQSLTEGLGQAVVRIEVMGDYHDPEVTTRALPLFDDARKIFGSRRPMR